MRSVTLSGRGWSARAVQAQTFIERLRGILGAPQGVGVVLVTQSVHSFWQRHPLEVVGLDWGMRVVTTRTLPPNRIVVLPSAAMIVELPHGSPLPDLGDRLEITDA
jgi:uncharacterized membrane protein (UPF0127 family)